MQAVLVMFRSDGERRSFSVTRDVTVIGRRDDCDLRIPLGDVSRKHARLIRDADAIRLEDLGSSNGTFLNGQRIERDAVLQAGDSIQVGPVVFVLQVDGHPADEELNPITSDAAAGGGEADGGFGGAALGAAVGAAALGLDDDDLGLAGDPGGAYDPLGEPAPAGEGDEGTLELGHAGDEGMDLLDEGQPAEIGEGISEEDPLALGEEPLAIGEDPLAIGGDELSIGEDPLAIDDGTAAGGNDPIALAGDDELDAPLGAAGGQGEATPLAGGDPPLGLADDEYEGIPLAGGEPTPATGDGEPADGGLELIDDVQPVEGGGQQDTDLDDLLIDLAPEPPKK